MRKILFLVKNRPAICYSYGNFGLKKSAEFISNKLVDLGYESKVVEIVDGNGINTIVSIYKPSEVFIEALWATPDKLETLAKLHPQIQWFVRIHSQIPFISGEGIAIEWIKKYKKLGEKYKIAVAANSQRFCDEMGEIGLDCVYTPNIYYLPEKYPYQYKKRGDVVNIGAMCAVRPLKNLLTQAVAAITFAEQSKKTLMFHINGTRTEQKGDSVLKNLRALFIDSPHKLVEHDWYGHQEFLEMLQGLDILLQVSFTETFNIVAADAVTVKVPVIASREIEWLPCCSKVPNPTSVKSIVSYMRWAYYLSPLYTTLNTAALEKYNTEATKVWMQFLN